MKRILITGGAGFNGTHLIKKILREYEVFVIDNFGNKKSNNNTDLLNDNHILFFKEDIRDKEKISGIIKECKADSSFISQPRSVFLSLRPILILL